MDVLIHQQLKFCMQYSNTDINVSIIDEDRLQKETQMLLFYDNTRKKMNPCSMLLGTAKL
jgi:hypothetical protein